MAQQFQLFPSFIFNESNVGPRPLRTVQLDRVGMAAQFNYGPAGATIADPNEVKKLYHFDNAVGSVHAQAVLDQSVGDMLNSRVLPTARVASLPVTIAGTAAGVGTCNVSIQEGSTAAVVTPVAITSGMTASQLVTAIVNAVAAVTGLPMALSVDTGNSGTNGKLLATNNVGGVIGNANKLRLEIVTSTGLAITPAGVGTALTPLAGGVDAPKAATLTLQATGNVDLLELTALSIGTKENTALAAKVTASLDAGKFDVVLTDSVRGLSETYTGVDLADVYDEDKCSAFQGSYLVAQGRVIAASGVPTPGTFTFSGGSDGDATVTQDDFVAAIDQLKHIQCTIIICPGLKPDGVDQAALDAVLVAQAESADTDMGELYGLRMAIISAPKGTTLSGIAALRTGNKIPDSARCVMVVGWATSARVKAFKRFGVDPAALYAGKLLVTPSHVSMAAQQSSPKIQGITEVDTPSGVPAWNEITRNRMDAIVPGDGGGWTVLNGRSTSSDPAWYWACYRRVYDMIRTDLFVHFRAIRSEPSNPDLDADYMEESDGYLQGLVDNKKISGYNPTISDDSNNPDALRDAGGRVVDLFVEPTPPNDRTQFNLNRVARGVIRQSVRVA